MLFREVAVFWDAINNEISIDRDLLNRLGRDDLVFTPLKGLKSLRYIDKYHISSFTYGLFAFVFCIFSPVYFLISMIRTISSRNKRESSQCIVSKNVVLVANGRVVNLVNQLSLDEKVCFLNINQPNNQNFCHVYQFLDIRDYLYAYYCAIYSVIYLLWKLDDKKDILQVYVAYQWFLVYMSLSKNKDSIETLYFANHYDRWAVMFDQLFEGKNIILIQHGTLPENLILHYKLKNLSRIFAFNESNIAIFKEIFDCTKTSFEKLDISLPMVEVNRENKTILIIGGHPQCMDVEIEIAKALSNDFDVFIKPHPLYEKILYEKLEYSGLKNLTVINDVGFYPKVDVALCYESTLGLQYETSGVQVIWWRGMDLDSISLQVRNSLKSPISS